ncbi:MAG: tRNA (adenosine(37)-N6)-threonylcarbamoyltransferase complex transferase subunit TsaD [Bacteroidales bacterium]|nr:tRNA (adenosine(37)-N6)-threonylcarbamoyltransferase complex transferase subunit TsaD [Bacteroidales bacterium]
MSIYILGIESSCDDTSAAVIRDREILSNLIANQDVHRAFGGVVPELASRAHQQNIIPVVEQALNIAKVNKNQLHAIAFTRGPGLLGSLLVGTLFAKSFALSLGIPVIEVDHMEAHILAHFIEEPGNPREAPGFPFLCLTVSGGHSQIVLVRDYFDFTIVGKTIDDAAGEAFDKAAKILGLPYPGGPLIDKLALEGNENAFPFPEPVIPGLDYSFSGLKTSFLYFIRDRLREDPQFIEKNKTDLAASIQKVIVDILMKKLVKSSIEYHVNDIAIAGGVSANSMLRRTLQQKALELGWRVFIPKFEFCTDNAAMVAMTGYFKYLRQEFASQRLSAYARGGERRV